MPFYYPNFQNDMWRIMGIIFYGDKEHFVVRDAKRFDQEKIETFLRERGIAMYDTATRVVRTKNTASDKDLLIVEETDVRAMLLRLPQCRTVVTAGQLATTTLCRQFGVTEPKVGERMVGKTFQRQFSGCKQRIIVTTFASNVHRIQQIIDAAAACGRNPLLQNTYLSI